MEYSTVPAKCICRCESSPVAEIAVPSILSAIRQCLAVCLEGLRLLCPGCVPPHLALSNSTGLTYQQRFAFCQRAIRAPHIKKVWCITTT